MTPASLIAQVLEIGVALAAAPLFLGWVNQCRAWLGNRRAPSVLLPYRNIRKLFHKDAVLAESASPLFRIAPYIVFGTMAVAAGIIPSMSARLPLVAAADAIALVGLFATARVFLSLAAMDVGTAFGSLGARREMMIGFLAEPALLMVIFVASLISSTTALPAISAHLATRSLVLDPSLAFTAVAFALVLLAENARIPVDNPATHLELTMIHEAMLLEYSARHLALMEWASALRLFNYACIGFALFVPWGIAMQPLGGFGAPGAVPGLAAAVPGLAAAVPGLAAAVPGLAAALPGLLIAVPILGLKLAAAGGGLALIETVSAKLRVMRAPEFLATAFLFAVLGLLVHVLLEGRA